MNSLAIGIDGGTNGGLAIWDRAQRQFIELKSYGFWPLIQRIGLLMDSYENTDIVDGMKQSVLFPNKQAAADKLLFVVEDISANRATFSRPEVDAQIKNALSKDRPEFKDINAAINSGIAMYNKISQNVGGTKAYTKLVIEYIKMRGYKVVLKKPGAKSLTKLTAEKFQTFTGCKLKSNEHTRDAAMLVFDY